MLAGRHRAGPGAARRARLARGGAPAGVPPAAGGDPRQRRRDRGRGPARGDPERAEDREQQHPHARRAGPPGRRRAGEPRHRPGHAGEPARAPPAARSTATCWSPRRASASASTTTCAPCSTSSARSSASGSSGCAPGAPVGFGLLRRGSLDRPAGQPGEHDGHLRAVRPARPSGRCPGTPCPSAGRCPCALAEPIQVRPKLQHFLRAVVSDGAGRARGPAHRSAGLRDSHLDGAGERAAGDSRRPVRHPGRRDVQAILLDDPVHAAEPPF